MADPAPVLFGGWRNLATAADAGYVEENMAFAMLPAVVARGTRIAVLDEQRKQTVCCLEVVSVPLEDRLLRHRFDLPGVWVSDLRNDWNIDHRPYLPEVFALQRRDALVDYHFDENGYGHLGACSSRPMRESHPRARCTPVARRSPSTLIPSRWPTTTAR
ncbi:hypothetical protein NWF32_13675 [Pseudomonas qingdaonensis]|nr:hypothetical protein [Pseudomonas qingdaonensis]